MLQKMSSATWETLRRIAGDIFRQPAESLGPDSSPETVESWDSVQHLNLVLAIEEHFGVQIEPEEFERMNTLEAISTLVESKLAG
jgi:acyl carrier protein